MIAGTIVIEDQTIHFRINGGQTTAHVTVTDTLTGIEETYDAPARPFMRALARALDFDGGSSVPQWHEEAELAQPANPALRFIP